MKAFVLMTGAEIEENIEKLSKSRRQHTNFSKSLGKEATNHDKILVSLGGIPVPAPAKTR